jgi:FkbM family methyltransferase
MIERQIGVSDAVVVKVGANDGITGDPLYNLIHKHEKWKVLFVEPVPYLFDRLIGNYGHVPRHRFEKAAINDGTSCDFYWVGEDAAQELADLPQWWDQLGSFNKEHILKHLNGRLAPFIRSERVIGLTIHQLFEKHDIHQIDLLHIDTEGYDWAILKQLDLSRYAPNVILFEHAHLSPNDRREALTFLSSLYNTTPIRGDTLACKKSLRDNRRTLESH